MISPEEMAIAHETVSEKKVFQFINAIRWLSEIRPSIEMGKPPTWVRVHGNARGSGLKTGVTNRKSRFSIFVSDVSHLSSLIINIRGPRGEMYSELLENIFMENQHRQNMTLTRDQYGSARNKAYEQEIGVINDGLGNRLVF